MVSIGQYEVRSKTEEDSDNRSYGTHTLPKKFWTIKAGTNCLNDDAFKKRRREKKHRYEQNKIARMDENRNRSSRT